MKSFTIFDYDFNNDENFQYEIFKIAQTKGYYKPAMQATPQEIGQVKTELQG